MNRCRIARSTLAGMVVILCASLTSHAEPARDAGKGPATNSPKLISVAEARERSKLMHEIHSATLEVLHRHFFHRDRAVLPARAMDDLFAEIDKQTKIKTRWIAVNTPAMSVDHKPESKFEKDAAEELALGKPAFERVEKGVYHRAGVIPLASGCVACHTRFGAPPAKTPRVAGIVISIPVRDK